MPTQPAVLGTARLNNFRLNYLTADQAAQRPARIWIMLGGIDISAPTSPTRVMYKSMTIRDLVFDTPNTCQLTFYGVAPTLGQRLEIWANRNEPALLFGGELQTVDRTYKGRPGTVLHPCTAIDDTAAANRKRPLGLWTTTSATTIAQWLISTYAPPGFSSAGVELGLPAVTVNFDGSEGGMKGCLTQLAKLIGGYWYFENRTLYLFVTPPGPSPDPINDTPGRFLHDPQITWTIDKSQVRTRVYGKGASSTLAATVDPTVTILPLEEVAMFNPAGGHAIGAVTPDGAASRVLTYTGVQLGGGGGLVGPGAAPSSAPGLTLATGSGLESGTHGYAVTFTTATGESLPGPIATIAVGAVAPPATAPGLEAPTTRGPGPSPGTHEYAVTYVTAVGETTVSPIATMATGVTAPPQTAPTPGAPTSGGSIDPGTYTYGTTFVTAIGETDLIAGSAAVAVPVASGNPAMSTFTNSFSNLGTGGPYPFPSNAGPWFWKYAFVTVFGETLPSPARGGNTAGGGPFYAHGSLPIGPAGVIARRIYRASVSDGPYALATHIPNNTATLWEDKATALGALAPTVNTTAPGTVPLTNIPTGPSGAGVTARKLYRWSAALGWKLLDTMANNTTTTYADTKANSALGAAVSSINTAYIQQIQVTLPIGPPLVTGRNVFRRPLGVGSLLHVAAIADNTTHTWTDTIPDASRGSAAPIANTATANRVAGTMALGGAGVTGRKLYRTLANQAALKFLWHFTDNTTATFLDSAPDGSLGAGPPVADSSGLKQPEGQVVAGAPAILVANTTAFVSSGGWAIVGNGEQAVQYTAVTATSLTGIPATGVGSLTATIAYNSSITASPALVGVTGILETMIKGAPVHVWVQRDDTAAQTSMAARDGTGDGVYEHIVSDERRSEASLVQVCEAELELYSRPLITVTYASRDTKTKSGKTVTIALTSPAMAESLTIQDVAISEIGIAPTLKPKFLVTASSVRHSFDAILQQLLRKAGA